MENGCDEDLGQALDATTWVGRGRFCGGTAVRTRCFCDTCCYSCRCSVSWIFCFRRPLVGGLCLGAQQSPGQLSEAVLSERRGQGRDPGVPGGVMSDCRRALKQQP